MSGRYIVWSPRPLRAWDPLPPAAPERDTRRASGGWRTLHEVALAIAATGRPVEMRGLVAADELEELAGAGGISPPALPSEPYRPDPEDTLVLSEGQPIEQFAYAAASPARKILLVLAPPGLIGWDFGTRGPDQPRAIAMTGFELWTHMPRFARECEETGVPCRFIGNGRPGGYPEPPPKRFDVLTVSDNRWSERAAHVVARLRPGIVHHTLGNTTNREVLEHLGAARMFVHPMGVEGHSRLGQEARGMGAVPVVLGDNPNAVGMDEAGGAVRVASLEEMPAAVEALLDDPPRLAELRDRAMRTAREQVDWSTYVERVDAALSSPAPDPGRAARSRLAVALVEDFAAGLAEREALRSEIEEMRESRVWRLARRYWALRRRLGRARS